MNEGTGEQLPGSAHSKQGCGSHQARGPGARAHRGERGGCEETSQEVKEGPLAQNTMVISEDYGFSHREGCSESCFKCSSDVT